MVQRGHVFAIVDEVDSILIDEARTPLIISGPLEDRADLYIAVDELMKTVAAEHAKIEKEVERVHGKEKAKEVLKTEGLVELDEKQRQVSLTEHGNERVEKMLTAQGVMQGLALRHRERLLRPPHQLGAEGAQAVPARPRLHRQRRPGRHHRRVHGPHDAGPALLGGPAPGARGQGARGDPAREPDAGLDHLPELLPSLRQARRHDRHRGDGGQRVHGHLRARRGRDSDQRGRSCARTTTTRSTARPRRSTPRSCSRSPTAAAAASRSSSAPSRSRSPSSSPSC